MFNIGICDDDKNICTDLENIIFSFAKAQEIGIETYVWNSGETLCKDLIKMDFLDLIFLDIELVKLNGIQVGRFIRDTMNNYKVSIIYISSKTNYAISLFKVHPLDFLIKPLNTSKIYAVLNEYLKLYKQNDNYFEYTFDGVYYKIPYDKIICFRSDNKKICIIQINNEESLFYGKLKDISKQLPNRFITIHQSYIVNPKYIIECSYELIKMANGYYINISQPYRKRVREQIKEYKWERENKYV